MKNTTNQAESFVDFLKAYGDGMTPKISFQDASSFQQWQKNLVTKLETLRGPVPPRSAPKVEYVEAFEEEDHTRYLIRITVSRFSTLPAFLLVPKNVRMGETRPGILASHGHIVFGMDSICGIRGMEDPDLRLHTYALFAVRCGYVVIAPSWWGWPGRDGHLELVGKGKDRCDTIHHAASMYGLSVMSLHIEDAQAAVDVLASRPEVDPDRIGCIGNSYGGRTTMWFSIFDRRIKVSVVAGNMTRLRERSLKLASCGIQYLPGVLQYADVPELLCLTTPRPMQLQAGEGDPLVTPSDRDLIERTVRRAYQLLGAEDKYSYILHPHGHLLLWEPARDFLNKHL